MATLDKKRVIDNKDIRALLEVPYTYNDYFARLSDQHNIQVMPPEIPQINKESLGKLLMQAVSDTFGTIGDLNYINNAAKAGFALIKLGKGAPDWAVGHIREVRSDSGY